MLQTLNSDDPPTRLTARSSLELHMSKRKVPRVSDRDEPSFGGFQVDEQGRAIKSSKINWPKSIWVELNEILMREHLHLEDRGDEFVIVSSEGENISLAFRSPPCPVCT